MSDDRPVLRKSIRYALIALPVLLCGWHGFVVAHLLAWFVVPLLPPAMAPALGIGALLLLVMTIDVDLFGKHATEDEVRRFALRLLFWTIIPGLALLLGWLVRVYVR